MRVYAFIAIFLALWVGCQSQPTRTRTIFVGMPLREAEQILKAKHAEDITKNVGILIGWLRTDESTVEEWRGHWYILADNTCVCLASGRIRGQAVRTIQSITVGEKGKGYPDKIEWMKQKQVEMQRLDL